MKNVLKHILNGIGTGIGLGLTILIIFVITQIIEHNRYKNYYPVPPEEPEELISEKGDISADNSTTDKELMKKISGHWWGITWDPSDEILYKVKSVLTEDGESTLYFDYLNKEAKDYYIEENGIWWIKMPYYHTQTEDFEETYKILYISEDYFVYQSIMSYGEPKLNGRIYIKTRVQSLLEQLKK